MRAAGIMVIVLACSGMALTFFSQVGTFIAQGARPHIDAMCWLVYFFRALPFHLIWIFVGIGFIALDSKLDKIINR